MPLTMRDYYAEPIQKELQKFFYDIFYSEILQEIRGYKKFQNSNDFRYLVNAILKGTVFYSRGVFSGTFNARISQELSKFATFDRRSRTWKGTAPNVVLTASINANTRAQRLHDKIKSLIDGVPAKLDTAIETMHYSIDTPLFMMDKEVKRDLLNLGIRVELDGALRESIDNNYKMNMDLEIKGWSDKQVMRLREMIEQNSLDGYSFVELTQRISEEYNVSMNKAKFLGRQETSLLLVNFRDTRYQGAGIREWDWSATGGSAGDGRTRLEHRLLHGQRFSYSSPPIIDVRTGQKGFPGEAFGCRCVLIPRG